MKTSPQNPPARNALRYRGYSARIDFDSRENIFIGEVVGMSEVLRFHGGSVDELRADFEFAIDHYLKDCEAEGRSPAYPASGKILLRLEPAQHAAALVAAQSEGISLNDWLKRAVEQALADTT